MKSIALSLLVLHGAVISSFAQDRPPVNYPGWIWADSVDPVILLAATYDSVNARWHYEYAVANGSGAAQDIITFDMRLLKPPPAFDLVTSQAPSGWWTGIYVPTGGIVFHGNRSDQAPGPVWTPSADQIPPGSTLSGFLIESPYPPGYARWYVQGYVPLPHLTGESEDLVIPHDTLNSRRGWTLGPTFYDAVLTPGDDGLTTDNFLGWMNISDFATILIDPAPIAIKFSVVGETVFPETFSAKLNGVDVTSEFLPGPSDGADRVAVFRLGDSPLVEGVNVIETSIEGIEAFTGVRGPDIDVMRFRVDPNCSVPQTIVCPS